MKLFLKLLKLCSYGVTFGLALLFGVTAKLLLHLMANQTKVNKAVKVCARNLPDVSHSHYHTLLRVDSPERIAWVWMLYFVLIAPDLLLFLRCLRTCLFKQYSMPDYRTILLVCAGVRCQTT